VHKNLLCLIFVSNVATEMSVVFLFRLVLNSHQRPGISVIYLTFTKNCVVHEH